MARKKKTLPVLENIEITDIAAEGKALAKIDGMAVFVPYVVPGDVVDIQLRRKKHSFAEGEAILFHKKSEVSLSEIILVISAPNFPCFMMTFSPAMERTLNLDDIFITICRFTL